MLNISPKVCLLTQSTNYSTGKGHMLCQCIKIMSVIKLDANQQAKHKIHEYKHNSNKIRYKWQAAYSGSRPAHRHSKMA